MRLGCVEFAVPGRTLLEKLMLLESRGMWLELVNDGGKRLREVRRALRSCSAPIRSVQAHLLQELRMLGPGEGERRMAVRHIEETMRMASELGAENVVTVLAYGRPSVRNPGKKCVELYRRFGELAEKLDVVVSIEPLGRDRTSFLPGVSEVYRLVRDIGSPNVRLMADTMHIHANGEDVAGVIQRYASEMKELQLRDTGSRPPGQGEIQFPHVLRVVHERFRGLLCLEYHPGPDPVADFISAVEAVRTISAAR
jgi:sugar phosphate isomerase/epimerase